MEYDDFQVAVLTYRFEYEKQKYYIVLAVKFH